jgi:O-antigen ligase
MLHLNVEGSTATPEAPPAPRRSRPAGAAFWLYAGHLFALFGIALSNVLVGLALLASPWAARGPAPVPAPPVVAHARRRMLVALGLYALWLLVAIAASLEPAVSLRAASELFTLATLVLALVLVRDEGDLRRVVDGLVVVAGAVAVWGLFQALGDYGTYDNRIRGPFSHWMTFSGFLLLTDLLLLATLAFRRGLGRWARAWRWLCLVVINAALLGSLTRSAWVAFAAAVLVVLLLRAPRLVALVPAAALAFLLLAPVQVLGRVLSIADLSEPSNYDRLCMLKAGLLMVAERPLTGLGPEMVEARYPIYRPPTATRYQTPHLHNDLLHLAAERGLPGLAAYLALVGVALVTAWRGYRLEGGAGGRRADLYVGSLLAVGAFNLAGLFEYNWGDTEVQRLVLFAMAMPLCLGPPAD